MNDFGWPMTVVLVSESSFPLTLIPAQCCSHFNEIMIPLQLMYLFYLCILLALGQVHGLQSSSRCPQYSKFQASALMTFDEYNWAFEIVITANLIPLHCMVVYPRLQVTSIPNLKK